MAYFSKTSDSPFDDFPFETGFWVEVVDSERLDDGAGGFDGVFRVEGLLEEPFDSPLDNTLEEPFELEPFEPMLLEFMLIELLLLELGANKLDIGVSDVDLAVAKYSPKFLKYGEDVLRIEDSVPL